MTSLKNMGHLSQAARIARKLADLAETLATSSLPLHQADTELLRLEVLQLYEEILQLKAENIDDPTPDFTEPNQTVRQGASSHEVYYQSSTPHKVSEKESQASETRPTQAEVEPSTPFVTPEPQTQSETLRSKNPDNHLPFEKKLAGSSTPDLFSDNTIPLVDKLAAQPDNSLAARLGKSPITDLRKAIGINDKFLFINELFDGSIQQYNHAIDELDGFRSHNGAKTYLIELSVLHGWDNESDAVKKLRELIDRKFEKA